MSPATPNVLVVEDEPCVMTIYRAFLSSVGLEMEALDHTGKAIDEVVAGIESSIARVLILDGNYRGGSAADILGRIAHTGKRSVVVTASERVIGQVKATFPETPTFLKGSREADLLVISRLVRDYVQELSS
jgi:DNA-binding NtrC family response regulator